MNLGDSVLVEIDIHLTLPLSNLEFEISSSMFVQVWVVSSLVGFKHSNLMLMAKDKADNYFFFQRVKHICSRILDVTYYCNKHGTIQNYDVN